MVGGLRIMVRVRMHGMARFIWISASLKQLAAFSEFMKKGNTGAL